MSIQLEGGLIVGSLLAGICLSACGPQGPTLTIHVNGRPAGSNPLKIFPHVDGNPGTPFEVDADISVFSIKFEQAQTNYAVLDASIVKSDCPYYLGKVDADFMGGTIKNLSKELDLVPYPSCPNSTCTTGQWCQQPPITLRSLQGVWADENNAWAVGDGGVILHWTPPSATMSGMGGTLMEGGGWRYDKSPTIDTLNAIWGSGPKDIWAVGRRGSVIHFDGMTWSKVLLGEIGSSTLYAVGGSSGNVWVGGDKLFKLANDSSSWIPITAVKPYIRSIWNASSGVGVVGTTQQISFLSSDLSVKTPTLPSPMPPLMAPLNPNPDLYGIWQDAQGVISVVGESGVIYTEENGNWEYSRHFDKTLYSISGKLGSTEAWAVGVNGAIIHSTGTGWNDVPYNIEPKQQLNSVFATASGTVWAVGVNGTILRYN